MSTTFEQLAPDGDPPSRGSRWCPRCRCWYEHLRRRRCGCGAALVRPMARQPKPRPGELRPGVVAEFNDPRDHDEAKRTLTELRARLAGKS
jgi:hypothetical protein